MMKEDGGPEAYETAEAMLGSHHIATLADTDEILTYDGGVYEYGAEEAIARNVEEDFREKGIAKVVSNNYVKEVLGHIRRRTYVKRAQFDQDPHVFNLKNGLLDLRTFIVTPHRSDYLSLVQLPISYDPDAKCPLTEKFLGEVLYAEDTAAVQEYVGCCLWREPVQKALLLHGEGANGKSLFINLVKTLLGPGNISARSLQDLEVHRFAKADLFGKLANLYPDLPDQPLKTAGAFKSLTGGDPITAEKKFQQPFTFTPYTKHIYSCNKIPEVYEDSTAFFRRWLLITFPNTFLGDRDNRNLLLELTVPEEASGFLNWAIAGLRRLQTNKWEFSNSKSVTDTRVDYIRKSSPLKAFIMDACHVDSTLYVVKQELYAAFVEYCRLNHLPTVTQTTFFRNLPMHAKVTTAQHGAAGNQKRCFDGLALRDRAKWGVDEAQETLS